MLPKDVTRSTLSDYLAWLIIEFNAHNSEPFLEALADDAVWIGPLDGQYLRSKEEIVRSFSTDHSIFKQETGSIYTDVFPHGVKQCDTVSFFTRTGSYPDSGILSFNMCYHISWVKRDVWQMSVISVMERADKDYRDSIYPNYTDYTRLFPNLMIAGVQTEKIMIHEKKTGNKVCLQPEQILRAEGHGHECTVFLADAVFTLSVSLRELVEMTGDALLQCHSGYAVNPHFVKSINRFRITLSDGTKVPVPEKRYTAVKTKLESLISGNGSE